MLSNQGVKDSQLHQDVSKVEEIKQEAEQQRQTFDHHIKRLQDDMTSLQVQRHEQAFIPQGCPH